MKTVQVHLIIGTTLLHDTQNTDKQKTVKRNLVDIIQIRKNQERTQYNIIWTSLKNLAKYVIVHFSRIKFRYAVNQRMHSESPDEML